MFILICRYNRVFAYPSDDVTLSCHLSPETSAVPMEVRWFRGTECIYLYKNGQVSIGRGYEGRASLLIPELKRGNVSLTLKSIAPLDTGTYSCQVLTGQNMVEKSVRLYMSGMEPLSPDAIGPKLTEQDSLDMQDSVLILELKKLLQDREKELQDKTRQLETTTEMLKTKSSLLLYTDMDLENMSKLANQKEEDLKSMASELDTCKVQLETLGRTLEEKNAQVEELRGVLQDRERELQESKEQEVTDGLRNSTQDTEESARFLELKNLLQNKEKELDDQTKQLESTTEELRRMMTLLKDRETEVENLAKERDGYLKHMTGEMELCLRELEILGQKLVEKNLQVNELRVVLQDKERELEEEKKRQGESEHVVTVNKMADVSHEPFTFELLEKSEALLSKERLDDLESWINKKTKERRQREEEERAAVLEKEFLDYITVVKELIGKKHETIVAWAKMAAVLQSKLEVVETDGERETLETQVKEALEMQRQGEEQIKSLTEDIEEKRSAIEDKHKHEIEEIREKYDTLSKIEAETNILKIILPDVQAYFRNIVADMQRILNAQIQIANEKSSMGYVTVDADGHQSSSLVKEELPEQTDCVETLMHKEEEEEEEEQQQQQQQKEEEEIQVKEHKFKSQDTYLEDKRCNNMINGMMVEEHEIEEETEEEQKQEEEREVNAEEHAETEKNF